METKRHPGSIGARARAFKWTTAPGGVSTPGPGRYDVKAKKVAGLYGRFSEAHPKTDIDLAQHRARLQPGPASYNPNNPSFAVSGGKFNESKPKTFIEQIIYDGKQIPGPGMYPIDREIKTSGGHFSTARPKSDVEWKIFRAKQMPGPGGYDIKSKAFPTDKPFSFMGRAIKGNHQTTLSNAVLMEWNTIQTSSDTCRSDASIGKQITSTQKSMPSFSFGGGKPFDLQEKNMKKSIDWASKTEKRRSAREKKRASRKQQADDMFERFFGYHPSNPRRKPQKPMLRAKRKPKIQKLTSPGPGAYEVRSSIATKLYKKSAPSFSFTRD